MQFTRSTYRRAIRLAENEVYSRADILQRAKDRYADYMAFDVPVTYVEYLQEKGLVEEARTEYFKALDLLGAIKDRAKREGKLK